MRCEPIRAADSALRRLGATPRYLQGRASASQFQPVPEREQPMRLLAARPQRAHVEPYSRSVKSTHDLMAARCAVARLR